MSAWPSLGTEEDPGIPLFWCPYCPLMPAWLTEVQRVRTTDT